MIETNTASKSPLGTGGMWFARPAICALVFLAGGSIVYWMAAKKTDVPKNFKATATVVEHFPAAAGSDAAESIPAFRPDPEAIKRLVLSEASLRQVAASGGPGSPPAATPADPESIRSRLRLASTSAAAGSSALTIEFTDSDRDQALRVVNELARRYADAHREAVDAMFHKADELAARAVQQSRRQWQQVEARRDEFVRRLPVAQPSTGTPASVPAQQHWVDNPCWADLQREHDDLLRRRQDLLQTRTPRHPQVLVVDDLIAESEAKLASVPRRLLAGSGDSQTRERGDAQAPGRRDARTVSPGGHAGMARAEPVPTDQRRLALDAAVQQARERLDQALRAEQTGRNAFQGATVEVQLADRCEAVAAGPPVPWRFLPMVLASGLALATAAGMFFTGLGIDPLVTSVGQLEASLPSPLLGPVPVPAGGSNRPVVEAWSVQALNAWAAILVVVCILAIAVALW